MKYFVESNGQKHEVVLTRTSGGNDLAIDGYRVELRGFEQEAPGTYTLFIDNKVYPIEVQKLDDRLKLQVAGLDFELEVRDERTEAVRSIIGAKGFKRGGVGDVRAPMPGLIVKVEVDEGQEVRAGQGLIVVEAMKMENEIAAPLGGTVKQVCVEAGKAVDKGQVLVKIEEGP